MCKAQGEIVTSKEKQFYQFNTQKKEFRAARLFYFMAVLWD